MNYKLVGKGDMTTTGGAVVEGVTTVFSAGRPVALRGMRATCPSCTKGIGEIQPLIEHKIFVEHGTAAIDGDIVACGCPPGSNRLIASLGAMEFIGTADGNSSMSLSGLFGGAVSEGSGPHVAVSQPATPASRQNADFSATQAPRSPTPTTDNRWQPVEGQYPMLVYRTERAMDDWSAHDLMSGDESREQIEAYGLWQPFRQTRHDSYWSGMTRYGEDQFALPAAEHFRRMRELAEYFSRSGDTRLVFSEMVDKFERNVGGTFSHPALNQALKAHDTTREFHRVLVHCLTRHVQRNGRVRSTVLQESSAYLSDVETGVMLPKFKLLSLDLAEGTVLTVHDIYSMEIYLDSLERKNNQLRGRLSYRIQDHFGLDLNDINHGYDIFPFELLEGFRSWYLLQHYPAYGYRPFITEMDFSLEFGA